MPRPDNNVRILYSLTHFGPATAAQLRVRLGLSIGAAEGTLKRLMKAGLVRKFGPKNEPAYEPTNSRRNSLDVDGDGR